MKKAKKCIVIVMIVLCFISIPCFPFVVCWGIDVINQMLSNYNLKLILQIEPLSISIGDYCSVILALLSCYVTIFLGYITYKLSISISQHNLRAENTTKIIIKHNIKTEINNNIKLIESIENKVSNNYADISTKQYSEVEISKNIHLLSDDLNVLKQLSDLYVFFEKYKEKNIIEAAKFQWLVYNKEEKIYKFKEIDFI